MKRIQRKWLVVSLVAVLAVGGGVAVAYWTNAGAGSGTAGTGNNLAVTVNQTSTVTGLAPGLPAQTLSGNFDNPNAGPVFVTAVTATVTATDQPGCGPTDYTIAGSAPVSAEIPAGLGKGGWTGLTIQFNNKAVNQDVCKNAVVTIVYASS